MKSKRTPRERAIDYADSKFDFWVERESMVSNQWVTCKEAYIAGYRAAQRDQRKKVK